jgi:hypothetical protein
MEQGRKKEKLPSTSRVVSQSNSSGNYQDPTSRTIAPSSRDEVENALQICEPGTIDSTGHAHPQKQSAWRASSIKYISNDPAVTGVATCSLGLANNLDDLTTAQTKVPSNGVGNLYTGKLGFLQTITLKEPTLLLGTEKDVLGDELVAGDVNKQVLFLEVLADTAGNTAQQTDGGWRDWSLRDEDSGVEVVFVDEVVEGADLLGSYA